MTQPPPAGSENPTLPGAAGLAGKRFATLDDLRAVLQAIVATMGRRFDSLDGQNNDDVDMAAIYNTTLVLDIADAALKGLNLSTASSVEAAPGSGSVTLPNEDDPGNSKAGEADGPQLVSKAESPGSTPGAALAAVRKPSATEEPEAALRAALYEWEGMASASDPRARHADLKLAGACHRMLAAYDVLRAERDALDEYASRNDQLLVEITAAHDARRANESKP